ncbi:MAG: hypothetical protein F6K54_27970 [Okeania sp. SIO3B5]|uniref:hypothetical protein n=1 Tax=Okeania sp. SIO3B5 TaxID=2607811 RepID=UPI001400B449|nr:hypothetical protein [Okeania sp. SIO3B5]NEO56575.1 hypothetical protein [Okeania sp. SIO3B5]
MSIRQTIEVRLIGDKKDIDALISSMTDAGKRDGYRLAKQPHYRPSRKEPEDIIAYTEWVIER